MTQMNPAHPIPTSTMFQMFQTSLLLLLFLKQPLNVLVDVDVDALGSPLGVDVVGVEVVEEVLQLRRIP